MPIFFRSNLVKGVNFLQYDGKSYYRTGKILPKDVTNTTPLSDVDLFYVNSCSATELGNQIIIPGGSVTVPTTATEFQVKFEGDAAHDRGSLILESPNGQTCTISLSVSPTSALAFDTDYSGAPSPIIVNSYPTSFEYTDCLSNTWNVTWAAKGSYYLTFVYGGKSVFSCGAAPIQIESIYRIGSDQRTGLGGQVHADPDDTTSPGYNLKYRSLNYGFHSDGGTIGSPIILQDILSGGSNVVVFTTGTGGNAPEFEAKTGITLDADTWGLSADMGTFPSGQRFATLGFPIDTYSTNASLLYNDRTRVCFSGTAGDPALPYGDKYFTIVREHIDIQQVDVNTNAELDVESDQEIYLRFKGTNVGDTATLSLSTDSGMGCEVEIEVTDVEELTFDTTSVGNGPLVFTTFPSTHTFVDCNGDEYDVTFTGLGSFRLTVGRVRNWLNRRTTNPLVAKLKPKWINYQLVDVNPNTEYVLSQMDWTGRKFTKKENINIYPKATNPTITMNVGDGLTFTAPTTASVELMKKHPIWISKSGGGGIPLASDLPEGLILNNGGTKPSSKGDRIRQIRFRPMEPGTYKYTCQHHAAMTGDIIVSSTETEVADQFDPAATVIGKYDRYYIHDTGTNFLTSGISNSINNIHNPLVYTKTNPLTAGVFFGTAGTDYQSINIGSGSGGAEDPGKGDSSFVLKTNTSHITAVETGVNFGIRGQRNDGFIINPIPGDYLAAHHDEQGTVFRHVWEFIGTRKLYKPIKQLGTKALSGLTHVGEFLVYFIPETEINTPIKPFKRLPTVGKIEKVAQSSNSMDYGSINGEPAEIHVYSAQRFKNSRGFIKLQDGSTGPGGDGLKLRVAPRYIVSKKPTAPQDLTIKYDTSTTPHEIIINNSTSGIVTTLSSANFANYKTNYTDSNGLQYNLRVTPDDYLEWKLIETTTISTPVVSGEPAIRCVKPVLVNGQPEPVYNPSVADSTYTIRITDDNKLKSVGGDLGSAAPGYSNGWHDDSRSLTWGLSTLNNKIEWIQEINNNGDYISFILESNSFDKSVTASSGKFKFTTTQGVSISGETYVDLVDIYGAPLKIANIMRTKTSTRPPVKVEAPTVKHIGETKPGRINIKVWNPKIKEIDMTMCLSWDTTDDTNYAYWQTLTNLYRGVIRRCSPNNWDDKKVGWYIKGHDANGEIDNLIKNPDLTYKVGDVVMLQVGAVAPKTTQGHLFTIVHDDWDPTQPLTSGTVVKDIINNREDHGTILWKPTTPGTYYYFSDKYRPYMYGKITIKS